MALDLSKRNEKLTLSLTKQNIKSIRAQVGVVFDRSGSMRSLYSDNTMQEYANRMVPLGLRFDDNGSIDAWAFNDHSYTLEPINQTNVENYVRANIQRLNEGGTRFAPVLNAVIKHYFGEAQPKPSFIKSLFTGGSYPSSNVSDPVYLIFQTDGANTDEDATEKLIIQQAKQSIYIQFVGVGNENFRFISRMAEKYDHVGFFTVKDLPKTSDETLYDLLINPEFKTFLKNRFPNNITEIA